MSPLCLHVGLVRQADCWPGAAPVDGHVYQVDCRGLPTGFRLHGSLTRWLQ